MASSRGAAAPGVILPTVPGMGSSSSMRPTKGTSSRGSSRVVKVPTKGLSGSVVKGPKIKVARPKMPKDANRLNVPAHKRVKNGKEFQVKRKPII